MNTRYSLSIVSALIVLTFPAVAEDLDLPVGRSGGVVSTVPIARSDSTEAPAQAVVPGGGRIESLIAGRPELPTGSASQQGVEDLNFVMEPDQHPWPLRYRELTTPRVLYLPLPEAAALRLMFPGQALDEARSARQGVAKYITDLIGVAASDRTRQLDTFVSWTEQTLKQKATLAVADEWQHYIFWTRVHESLDAYRSAIVPQSEHLLQQRSTNIHTFVTDVTALMNAAQGYEQRTAWYQVLVQLKEGLQMYQIQMQEGDAQVLQAIDTFRGNNPPVARPHGPPPTLDERMGKQALPKAVTAPATDITALPALKAEPAPDAKPVAQGNSVVAYGLIALALAAVAAGFLKIRRRKPGQPPAA